MQFQITVNITAVLLTFVSAVASPSQTSILTAVQLLWVNLIMDTFAALALATDPPMPSVLDRKPEPKSAPLINATMWKMIIGQTIYQLIVTLVLNFAGSAVFGLSPAEQDGYTLQTIVFNAFVWMQIFNQYNCRRIDNRLNIFEGVLRNRYFMAIQVIIIGGQVLIVFVGGDAFNVARINAVQWAASLVIGFVSLIIGVLIRLIPDSWCIALIPSCLKRQKPKDIIVESQESSHLPTYVWNPGIEEIRQELTLLKLVRGGRLNVLKYRLQHPGEFLSRSLSTSHSRTPSVGPQTPNNELADPSHHEASPGPAHTPPSPLHRPPGLRGRSRSNSVFAPAAAMAGIVAGSIAGWSPMERRETNEGEGKDIKDLSP
jgi:P-type Ca2+ transporter type 2C